MKIIFIANAPFGSKKISVYQTLCQAQSLGKKIDLTLIIPKRFDTKKNTSYQLLASKKLNIKEKDLSFEIRCINYFDICNLKFMNERFKFTLSNLFFSISSLRNELLKEADFIYTRDVTTMILLSITKFLKLNRKNTRTIFESHQYRYLRNKFLRNIDFLITINKFQAKLYNHKKTIVLHDAVWEKEIINSKKSINKKTILYSGTCSNEKGILRLLKLSRFLPNYKFYIASINNINSYKCDHQFNQNIEWLGKLSKENLYDVMDLVEYCILPNDPNKIANNYTSPMKLFEYMARGKALILSPIPSVKEIFPENSFISLGFNESDISKAANEIQAKNSEEISKISNILIHKYTWEKRAELLLKFITKKEPKKKSTTGYLN